MGLLGYLTITLFAIWCLSEIVISLISLINRSKNRSGGVDRFSYFLVWFSTVPPIAFEYVLWAHPDFFHGFGNFSAFSPLTGYSGCLFLASGITLRLLAVATLKKQFTLKVSIVDNHTVVDTGIYRIIRHPAYLGHLASLFGIGLILGNWVGLTALVVLPLTAILYRIHVEEAALVNYFGPAYQAYSSRTKRLLPGIW